MTDVNYSEEKKSTSQCSSYEEELKSNSDKWIDLTDDDGTPSTSPKSSWVYKGIHEQTVDILQMLRQGIDSEEWKLKENYKIDNATQPIEVEKLFRNMKKDNFNEGQEPAPPPVTQDKSNETRIAQLEEARRPKWFTLSLKVAFHICVILNFFMAWYDSARLLLEDVKVKKLLLENDYNCLKTATNLNWLRHTMNLIHALLSCSILFVHGSNNASLCLTWICSEGAHTVFKTLQYFNILKLGPATYNSSNTWHWHWEGLAELVGVILLDAFCALLLLQKYYDATGLLKIRNTGFGTKGSTTEKPLNDRIIYKSQTAFLQKKNILRDVTTAQTFAVMQKLAQHKKQGTPIDEITLDREINAAKLALDDCAAAENDNMLHVLNKAYARRLRQLINEEKQFNNTQRAQSNVPI